MSFHLRPCKHRGQGRATLSSVLRSLRAVEVNSAIMRTFTQLRRLMGSTHHPLSATETRQKPSALH